MGRSGRDAALATGSKPIDMRVRVPPPLAVEVYRPALDALLDAASQHRLTVVTAGAGWGKTTVVAGWVRRSEGHRDGAATWLTLEAGDDGPASFWDAVLQAVVHSGAVPHGHPLRSLSTAAGVSDEVLLRACRGLAALREPLVLVLDDFHVIESRDVLGALADLMAHDTPLRLMLLTRSDPALPLHRLRLGGRLAEIRAADLAFDAAAASDLAMRAESLHLTSAQVDAILARTEGWAAGVRLATMYLSREGADPELHGFTGTDRSVAEFLVAEVLERHDASTTEFLMRTSVAEQLTGDLADAIVPGRDGLARLEMLERANHFVVCVDRARGLYRYHPLLRDLLLHRLRRDDPEGYRAAHRAAAVWLAARGDPVEALGHAVATADWALVSDVFLEASPSVLGPRRFTVARHLRAIPFDTLPSSPALELCAAALELVSGHLEAVAVHAERARRLASGSHVLPPVGEAALELLTVAAARHYGDVPQVVEASTAALAHLAHSPPGPAIDGMRTIASTQRAVGLLLTGDTQSAYDLFTATIRSPHQGEATLAVFAARSHVAWCHVIAGRLDEGEVAAREVLRDASKRGWTSLVQVHPAHLALAMVHTLRADMDDAYRAVSAGLAAVIGGVDLWPTVALRLTQASNAVTRDRPRAALSSLEKAVAAAGDLPVPLALVDTMSRATTDVALLIGDAPATRPREGAGTGARSATWWSSRARRDLAHGDLEGAAAAADRVPRSPGSDDLVDLLAAVEACLVLALLADRRRHPHEASRWLRSALDLARAQRLVRPFLAAEPVRVSVILRRVATEGLARTDEFIHEVLATLTRQRPTGPEPEPLVDPLTERELAVLAELPTMRTNAEIAAEFLVSTNTVKTQLQHLFRKLGVSSRREAVRRGRELGLIA
jgi:LuxR family maltose regulon positive regulatory protein